MLKIFEMFAGYGGASFALKKANIPFECVGYSEIDKYAIQCFEQNHRGKNYGDCTKINTNDLPDFDLLTGGFPCQDVSLAGKRDLTKGRTNLYQEILRIAKDKKPKYLLLENVKGLLSAGKTERINDLLIDKIIRDLKELGYGVCWKVLNSKDYGIPQNRERVWFVCKYGGWDFMEFQFPQPIELKIFIKDILEKDVDKKYYLSEKMIKGIFKSNFQERKPIDTNDVCRTLKIGGNIPCFVHSLFPRSDLSGNGGHGHLSKNDGTSYAIDTGCSQTVQIGALRGRGENNQQQLEMRDDNISNCLIKSTKENLVCQTITTELAHSTGKHFNAETFKGITGEFRRLTPKECFRLMGFLDDNINLKGLSDTQCYKLAGNGWEINVVSLIFKELFGTKSAI